MKCGLPTVTGMHLCSARQAQREAISHNQASTRLPPFGKPELRERILGACGMMVTSYGAPGRRRRTTVGSASVLAALLGRVRVFALPVVDVALVQQLLTNVPLSVATDYTAINDGAHAGPRVTVTLQNSDVHTVQLHRAAFGPLPLVVPRRLRTDLGAAKVALKGRPVSTGDAATPSARRRHGGSRLRPSSMRASPSRHRSRFSSEDVASRTSPGRAVGSPSRSGRLHRAPIMRSVSEGRGEDSGDSDDSDAGRGTSYDVAPMVDIGLELPLDAASHSTGQQLLSNTQRRLARKKVVASVCRIFATGAWPPPQQGEPTLRYMEPEDASVGLGLSGGVELSLMAPSGSGVLAAAPLDGVAASMGGSGILGADDSAAAPAQLLPRVVVISVQAIRLDVRGLELEDFVRWKGDGVGSDSGSSGSGGAASDSPSPDDDVGDLGGLTTVRSPGDLGLGGGSRAGAGDLFPHYYPRGRLPYEALGTVEGFPSFPDPDTGLPVYLDEEALTRSFLEDITLWLTAFDCMVSRLPPWCAWFPALWMTCVRIAVLNRCARRTSVL